MEVFPIERTLTQIDYVRLTRLMARAKSPVPQRSGPVSDLEELLCASELVAPTRVAPDIVTMYSQVLLLDSNESQPYKLTLCYPDDAEPAQGFVSVLSPVGLSLLGLRAGSTALWRTPHGETKATTVLAILFQPEASGDYTT